MPSMLPAAPRRPARPALRAGAVVAAALLAAVPLAGPAAARGPEVGGSGTEFHLSDSFSAAASTSFSYGGPADQIYVGDWDGDGAETLAVRRGATFHVRNDNAGGPADQVLTYGRPGDVVLVGDWDGDGRDTFAVRRGAQYHVKDTLAGGPADAVVVYGRAGDVVLVGDWDGDGRDTLGVRRGAEYHLRDAIAPGPADRIAVYGRAGDTTLVGDWDGDGRDTLGVRRGAEYHLRDTVAPGPADRVVVYGRAGDTTLVGDWDGDGVDSLGVRRDPRPQAPGTDGGLTGAVPRAASGTLLTVAGSAPAPRPAAREVAVRVQVEDGLPVDGARFADAVLDILNDPRGWGAHGSVAFSRGATGDVSVILASPATLDRLCAPLNTNGYTSCRRGTQTVINAQRWAGGATAFNAAGGDIAAYRQYVINHEVGHFLGHGHVSCPGAGRVAPVMLQQTLAMGGCLPNGWPNP